MKKNMNKKNFGQYFTTSEKLQNFVFEKVKHKNSRLLEPSFGAGHLLKKFKEYDENYRMTCYEIDTNIKPIFSPNRLQTFVYIDFLSQKIQKKFKTIIGNPPFVKQQTGNLYIKFVETCYDYLDNDGEMIFIVPSDFIKLTSASSIITKMLKNGSFTDFLFPHDEKLFDEANIDVMVFRYERNLFDEKVIVNDKKMFCNVNNGILTFSECKIDGVSIFSLFDVYVGLVSGRDEIYHVPFGNVDLLDSKNVLKKYIFIEKFPCGNEKIDSHLLLHKTELLKRKIRKFSEKNWFEWGAPRNIENIRKNHGRKCIYVKNLTRDKEVAFIDTVQYFGGKLLCLIPKKSMSDATMQKIVDYINSLLFKQNYIYAGRFKIGHRQIGSATFIDDGEKTENTIEYQQNTNYNDTILSIIEISKLLSLEKNNHTDGRINSAINESSFLLALETELRIKYTEWKIAISPPRASCDIIVNSIKINLKLTDCKTADNSVSKFAIYYSITGSESYPHSSNWNEFHEHISQAKIDGLIKKSRHKPTEYHYLVKNKITGEVLLKPIFDIHTYISNPSNFLQINWKNEFANMNYRVENDTYDKKVKSLLGCIQKSVREMIERSKKFAEMDIDTIL